MTIRGNCHIVPNKQGSIYEMDEDMKMWVTLRQRITTIDDIGNIDTDIREVKFNTDLMDLRENICIPGNILQIARHVPIDESDKEYGLIWYDGKLMKDTIGRPLYRYLFYDINSTY